ncbi:uncharacterized protein BX663DRAFT_438846 [Cokeromyces recurvatus]|uniref:uncharacterized protein n=1 Tax=Cokeromyces recurvatus TaxID=90255 RepID=UPI002220ECED|nr:uncharacterized protein BX663DRAFT_438846 [Cokeromyces recurvatus]KAI7900747.1 hypothetical protein BX663DRAFT_438846 [Cokeromyces recurvatus]
MPLDYSKWDKLELSDDSDIEVHPNVDKRSMIKWKREAIHRERAERKAKMDYLSRFISQQQNVLKKVQELIQMLKGNDESTGLQMIMQELNKEQTEAVPGMKVPASDGKEVDISQVFALMKAQIEAGLAQQSPAEVKKSLLDRFEQTEATVQKKIDESTQELEKLEKEANKKLTSDNMFTKERSSKTIINKPKPLPTKTDKKKEKVIETLNPNATMKDLGVEGSSKQQEVQVDEEENEDEDIEMTPNASRFSKLKGFEDSYKFLNNYPEIINEKTSDSILGQAFTAQLKGDESYAKNCVIQSLMIQYCGQLGKNGVNLFFSKMSGPNSQGRKMFFDDVEKTYDRIRTRCAEIAAEEVSVEQGGVETIQLQPMGDGTQLTIRVPTPEDEEPYQVFCSLPTDFQEALKTGKLEEINKVLEKTPVTEAENFVKICSDYGFLDVEGEVIDQTGKQ